MAICDKSLVFQLLLESEWYSCHYIADICLNFLDIPLTFLCDLPYLVSCLPNFEKQITARTYADKSNN